MSIAGGLSAALSGLNAAARAAEIVSSNIANAMTPGYGRREVMLASRLVGSSGQGVTVTGILRHSDPILLGERRMAQAASGGRTLDLDYFKRIEAAFGTPDTATSLTARIGDFDAALIEAASRPESDARLSRVLQTAKDLAAHIAKAGASIQTERETADQQIARQVESVNSALAGIAEINGQIRSSAGAGRDVSALLDQRQQLIDSVAEIIPLREAPRENGQVALYATGGAILLEGVPAKLGFEPTGTITPEMSLSGGALSGLTLNGKPVITGTDSSPIAGGALASAFDIRDSLAPKAQAQLDALARDLIERFADPALDPSLPAGSPGLFTDDGAAFSPSAEVGLAQRLRLNTAADPASGGSLWRLRDGLGAATPGPIGQAGLLRALQARLVEARPAASALLSTGSRSFAAFSSEVVSGVATDRVTSESDASYAMARLDTLRQLESADGVDTDQEMQSLLLIEQAYSANAKVISAVGDMIHTLLEI